MENITLAFKEEYLTDFELWSKDCVKIKTKKGEISAFIFNRMQRRLWRGHIRPMLEEGLPVRMIILKARQLGTSTFIIAFLSWIAFLRENRRLLISAHKEKPASELFEKVRDIYDYYPVAIRPAFRQKNRGRLHLMEKNPAPDQYPGLNSDIVVRVGVDGLGRSGTFQGALLSEIAFHRDPKKALIGLRNAIPNLPGTALFLESTANGANQFKDLWDDESSDLIHIFISWVAEDGYRLEIDGEDYWTLTDFDDPQWGNEVKEAGYVRKELHNWHPEKSKNRNWLEHEVMCRLAWRRHTIKSECMGDLFEFMKEYPTTAEMAFAMTGKNIFDTIYLGSRSVELNENPPEIRKYRWNREFEKWERHHYGPLRLFEPVVPDGIYVVGGDTAEGVRGGDPSAFQILRLSKNIQGGLIQAGSYEEVIEPYIYAQSLNAIGIEFNYAFVGIESNERGGFAVNNHLYYKYQYRKLFIYGMVELDDPDADIGTKLGWRTNQTTKPIMIEDTRFRINDESILLKDEDTVSQMISYQKLSSGQIGCPRPKHDDLVIALMIAIQMAKVYALRRKKKAKVTTAPKYSLEWWASQGENKYETRRLGW